MTRTVSQLASPPWPCVFAELEQDDLMWSIATRLWRIGDYGGSLQTLARWLDCVRGGLKRDDWLAYIEMCHLGQELADILRQCPLAKRTISKPRGFAGDAETLDLIYACGSVGRPVGEPLPYAAEFGGSPACSVRERAMLLAGFIDDVCRERPGARILSVAAGHLREAGVAHSIRTGSCAELVAFDQDPLSIEVIRRECADLPCVKAVCGNVTRLIAGRNDLGAFDAIYCAGLYDYLSPKSAKTLTRNLISMLRTRGRLLIANFAPDTQGIGFMECVQDWFLVYRGESEMVDLVDEESLDSPEAIRTFRDRMQNIVFLEVRSR